MIWLIKLAPPSNGNPSVRWEEKPRTPPWWRWTRLDDDFAKLSVPDKFYEWVERVLEFGNVEWYARMDGSELHWDEVPDWIREHVEERRHTVRREQHG